VDGSASSLQSLSDKWDCRCYLSHLITDDIGNRFIFAVLASSASYIAVPAAMKKFKSKSGIFLPMALAITFPFNITFGMPIYLSSPM
jgi:hypothetical protein